MEDEKTTHVIEATWGNVPRDPATHLWIDLEFDPLAWDSVKPRSLLQTLFASRWGSPKGKTVFAYEEMMMASRETLANEIGDRMSCEFLQIRPCDRDMGAPHFAFCIYPVTKKVNVRITRLDFRVL